MLLPNKRLKLAGAARSKGSGVLCPGGHGLSSNGLAPAGGGPGALAGAVRGVHQSGLGFWGTPGEKELKARPPRGPRAENLFARALPVLPIGLGCALGGTC